MSRAKGDRAEQQAMHYLQQTGYTIIEQNFYSRFGEIDIIAMKDEVLIFIEVKSAVEFELAIRNITQKKISRILKTADVYMKQKGIDSSFEVDAIVVTPQDIELIENITL